MDPAWAEALIAMVRCVGLAYQHFATPLPRPQIPIHARQTLSNTVLD